MERLRALGMWISTGLVTFGLAVTLVLSNHVLGPARLTGANAPTIIATSPRTTPTLPMISVLLTAAKVTSVHLTTPGAAATTPKHRSTSSMK